MRGLTAFCRIRSYIATAKAHGIGVLTALRDAFLGNLDHPGFVGDRRFWEGWTAWQRRGSTRWN
jgi:hypothetical protein